MADDKKPTTTAFGQSVNVSLTIQAQIETVPTADGQYSYLRFDVVTNGEHLSQAEVVIWFCIADGKHYGEHSGPEWEAMQAHWQKQCDYLHKHLGSALSAAAIYLCGEAVISQLKEWNLDVLLDDSYLSELEQWSDRHDDANDKNGAFGQHGRYGPSGHFRFSPQNMAALYPGFMWERLKGQRDEDEHIEISFGIGHISKEQHEMVITRYPAYVKRWHDARRTIRHSENWRDAIKETCGTLPEDLLAESLITVLRSDSTPEQNWRKPKYKPNELALVHLAREARILSSDGKPLQAHQANSIRRAINQYSKATGKPKLVMPKKR